MMKHEQLMELQAHLDGELSGRDAERVGAWLAQDKEAQMLRDELLRTKRLLVDNEPEIKLPASREFYWSQIQRVIERVEPASVQPAPSWWQAWRRLAAPLAGVAMVAMVTLFTVRETDRPGSIYEETENPSEETGALTFRSESQRVTVVWLYDKTAAAPDEELEENANQQ